MRDPQNLCPECGGGQSHRSFPTAAIGAHGPDLLPGLSSLLSPAEFNVIVCADCGLTRLFATPQSIERLAKSELWKPLR